MSTNYPGATDDTLTLPNPSSSSYTNNPDHAQLHDNENDAIKAIESKVGTGASTPTAGKVLLGTAPGISAWSNAPSTDKNFVQVFTSLSTVSVNHGLAKKPSVTVIDSAAAPVAHNLALMGCGS